ARPRGGIAHFDGEDQAAGGIHRVRLVRREVATLWRPTRRIAMPAARAAVLSLLTLLGFCGSALGADRVMFEVSAEDTSPDTPTRAARELTDGKWHVSAEPS